MNETAHTQTPWEIGSDPYTILTENRGIIAKTTHYWVDPESAKANAEFIVKACNSFDQFTQLAQMIAGRMYDDSVGMTAVTAAEELLDRLGILRRGTNSSE